MTIRELMVEVDREIEAGKASGAWEFDYHAAMEEVDALLNDEMRRRLVDEDAVEALVEEVLEYEGDASEKISVSADAMEPGEPAKTAETGERSSAEPLSGREDDLLSRLMKGIRKDKAEGVEAMCREIIAQKPTSMKDWRTLRFKHFPGKSVRQTLERFKKAAAIEWDGNLKSDVVWL